MRNGGAGINAITNKSSQTRAPSTSSARDHPQRSRKATRASKTSRSKVRPSRSARSRERNARSDGMRISSMPACRGVALIRSTSCVTCRTDNIRYPEEVWPKGDEQVAVVALLLRAGPGEQSQRLYHQRQPEAFVAAERKQSAAACKRRVPGWLAVGPDRHAFGKQLAQPLAQHH